MLFKKKQVNKQDNQRLIKAYCVYYYEGYTKYRQYFKSEYKALDCLYNLSIQFGKLNTGWCDVIVDANTTVFED